MLKVGDEVYTTKGDRFKGTPGVLTVIETGRTWGAFNAVICRKPDGTKRLFLTKNLKLCKKGGE